MKDIGTILAQDLERKRRAFEAMGPVLLKLRDKLQNIVLQSHEGHNGTALSLAGSDLLRGNDYCGKLASEALELVAELERLSSGERSA